jgi:hypothetical protein
MLDAIEEQMRVNDGNQPPDNKFFQTVRSIGDWLIDKTENSDGEFTATRICILVFGMRHIFTSPHMCLLLLEVGFLPWYVIYSTGTPTFLGFERL